MISLEEVKKLIDAEVKPLTAKIKEYERKVVDLEKSHGFMSTKYDEVLKQLQSANSKLNKLEKSSGDTENIKIAVDSLEQYIRRDCIEITGIDSRMLLEHQSYEDVVRSLGTEMGVEIADEDISTVHPLPTYDTKKDKKLIVKFTRRDVKNEFYSKRKHVAGKKISSLRSLNINSDKKVYISESLTPLRKKIFGAANNLKRKCQWKYIWTNNGRIYLKESEYTKIYTIDSIHDLAKLEEKLNLPKSKIS